MYKDSGLLSNSLVKTGKADQYDLYTINIGVLSEADYGNYSCVARNNLGTSTDFIIITGKQQWMVEMTSGETTTDYNI